MNNRNFGFLPRIAAGILVMMLLLGVLPFSVFAVGRLEEVSVYPVKKVYVSVEAPDTSFYEPEALYVDGSTAKERIAFITYAVAELEGKTSLPVRVGNVADGSLGAYLIDNWEVPENLTYNNMPIVGAENYVGQLLASQNGYAALNLTGLSFAGEYATFVIRAPRYADYTYEETFDTAPIGRGPFLKNSANNANYQVLYRTAGVTADDFHNSVASDKILAVKGGYIELFTAYTPTVTDGVIGSSDTDNGLGRSVRYTDSVMKGGRAKFYNVLKSADLNIYDIGRTFRISVDVLAPVAGIAIDCEMIAETSTAATKVKTYTLADVGWQTLTYEVTVDAGMVANQRGLFGIRIMNDVCEEFFVDNLKVTEITDEKVTETFDSVPLQRDTGYLYYDTAKKVSDEVNRIYSETALARRGGGPSYYLKVVPTPVLENGSFADTDYQSEETGIGHSVTIAGNIARFYNLLKRSSFDYADIGVVYHVKARLLTSAETTLRCGVRSVSKGEGTAENPTSAYYSHSYREISQTLPANEWTTVEFDLIVDQTMVEQQIGLLAFWGGTKTVPVYIDEITVTKSACAATEICHRHFYDREVITDAALKTPSTAVSKAIYFRSCVCGAIDTDEENTFEVAHIHTPGAEATATLPQVCTECGTVLAVPTDETLNTRYSVDTGNTWIYSTFADALAAVGSEDAVIEIFRDVTLTANIAVASSLVLRSLPDVGNICTVSRATSFTDNSMITIAGGGSLELENITLDGCGIFVNHSGAGLYLADGATATIENGTTICGGKLDNINNNIGCGGGVYVSGGATLTMNGGSVQNNTAKRGANVYLHEKAKFIMTGGVITGGYSTGTSMMGPAVYLAWMSRFEMSGGLIIGNQSIRNNQNGVLEDVLNNDSVSDGAVCFVHGAASVVLSGNAIIRGNTAKTLSTGQVVNSDIAFYGNNYRDTSITIAPDFSGSVGIWFPGTVTTDSTPVATAGTGYIEETILPGVVDCSSGRVAKIRSDGKIIFTDALAEIDRDGRRTRYTEISGAFADAGSDPVILLADTQYEFSTLGDSICVALNGFTLTPKGNYGCSFENRESVVGTFTFDGKRWQGTEMSVTTITADTMSAVTSASVTVGKDLSLNVYAFLQENHNAAKLAVTMNDHSVVLTPTLYRENTYRYIFTGITPQCIGDVVTMVLFTDNNGNDIADEGEVLHSLTYSVKDYCYALLGMSDATLGMTAQKSAAMKTVVRDLLAYGSAAQVYTGHNTDALVDSALTTAPSEFPGISEDSMVLVTNHETDGVRFLSATAVFSHVNALQFKFSTPDAAKTVLFVDGKEMPFVRLSDSVYSYTTDGLYATELNKQFTLCIVYDGIEVQTLTYGMDSYIFHMQDKREQDGTTLTAMAKLARATYNYGRSAIVYRDTDPTEELVARTYDGIAGKLLGDAQKTGTAVSLASAAAGVEYRFYGKGDISVNLTATSSAARVEFTVDGNVTEHYSLKEGTADDTLITGLAEGYHTIRVVSENGMEESVTLNSITVSAGYLLDSPESVLRIEYIGGAVTGGKGLFESVATDSTQSYAYLSALSLGADYRIVVREGAAICYGGENKNFADFYTPSVDIPNLAVIELGSVDDTATAFVQEDFDAAFENMVTTIRNAYGNIPILFVFAGDGNAQSSLATARMKALIGTDSSLKMLELTSDTTGTDNNPSVGGAAVQSAELSAYCRKNFESLLPDSVLTSDNLILDLKAPNATTGYQTFHVYVRTSDPSGDYYIRYIFEYEYNDIRDRYGADTTTNISNYRIKTAQVVRVNSVSDTEVRATAIFNALQRGEISLAIRGEGKADFVGGFHGDERLSIVKLILDGAEIPVNGEARVLTGNSIIFDQTTTLYEQGTSTADSFGNEMATHTQHFTITKEGGIHNRQTVTWAGEHILGKGMAYLQMFTMFRLNGENSKTMVCETFETFDGFGKSTGSVTVTDPVTTQTDYLSNVKNRLVKYSSALSGVSARCGFTVLNDSLIVQSARVSVRKDSIGDNKWYVSFCSPIGGNTVSEGECWALDAAYRIDYTAPMR